MAQSTPEICGELRAFDPLYAPMVASWVQTPEELRWLAPRTSPPLTQVKVVNWTRKTGKAFLFFKAQEPVPCGYGELNPMKGDPSHHWIGHVLIDSERRRQGLGHRLTDLLTEKAFGDLEAKKVSLVVFPQNKPALECYLKCGFKVVAEEFHRIESRSKPERMIRLGKEGS